MVTNTDPLQGMSPEELEASIRGVANAPEPGTARPATMREIIGKLDDEYAVPDVAELVSGHGYSFIWDTRTYERSYCSRNLLEGNLKLKRGDGSFFYTTIQPKDESGVILWPWRGNKKCLLHPEHPNADNYKHLGLPECRKSNIPSEYMVQMHIEHKHSDAWAIIKAEKAEVERIEDRAQQKAMIEEMVRRNDSENVPMTFSVDDELAKVDTVPETAVAPKHDSLLKTQWKEDCKECNVTLEAKGRLGLNSKMRSHMKREHPDG